MSELFFVIKSLFVSLLILLSLQIKVGPETMESHFTEWVEKSWVTNQLQTVSKGMALALEDGAKKISGSLRKAFGNTNPQVENASRMNFEFKRNPAVIEEQKLRSKGAIYDSGGE